MKNISVILFILLFASCYTVDKPQKPENLIAKDRMVSILIDMSVLNSAKGVNKKILDRKGVNLQQHIFRKHEIDSAQFASSNHYYTYQIDDYKDIYKKVKDSLKLLKEKYTAIEKTESDKKKKRDSIKRSKLKEIPVKTFLKEPLEPAVYSKNRKVSSENRKVSRKLE